MAVLELRLEIENEHIFNKEIAVTNLWFVLDKEKANKCFSITTWETSVPGIWEYLNHWTYKYLAKHSFVI